MWFHIDEKRPPTMRPDSFTRNEYIGRAGGKWLTRKYFLGLLLGAHPPNFGRNAQAPPDLVHRNIFHAGEAILIGAIQSQKLRTLALLDRPFINQDIHSTKLQHRYPTPEPTLIPVQPPESTLESDDQTYTLDREALASSQRCKARPGPPSLGPLPHGLPQQDGYS